MEFKTCQSVDLQILQPTETDQDARYLCKNNHQYENVKFELERAHRSASHGQSGYQSESRENEGKANVSCSAN